MASDSNGSKTITLSLDGKDQSISLPVLDGSVGPDVVDIRKLYGETGMFTFDPGYGATGSCVSGLTYIDGDEGILMHRGYPIEELAEHSDFLEVAYLLLEGELPNAAQKAEFDKAITQHTGPLRAEGKVLSMGRRTAFAEARLVDATGRLHASATSTLLIIEHGS